MPLRELNFDPFEDDKDDAREPVKLRELDFDPFEDSQPEAKAAPAPEPKKPTPTAFDTSSGVDDLGRPIAPMAKRVSEEASSDPLQASTDVARSIPAGAVKGLGMAARGVGTAYEAASRAVARPLLSALRATGLDDVADAMEAPLPWWMVPSQIVKRPGQEIVELGETIGAPKERQNTGTAIGEGLGQVAGQITAALLSGGASTATTTTMLYGQGVDQMEELRKENAPEKQDPLTDAAVLGGGAITALTERMGLDKLLERVPPNIKNSVLRQLADVSIAGGIEAVQEVAEGILQRLTAVATFAPNIKVFEGVQDDATVGGSVGAIARGMLNLIVPGRSAPPAQPEPPARIEPTFDRAPLTDADLASPLQNDLLAEGKAIFEKVARGEPLQDPIGSFRPGAELQEEGDFGTSLLSDFNIDPLSETQIDPLQPALDPTDPLAPTVAPAAQLQEPAVTEPVAEPAIAAPTLRKNGTPFKTEGEARLAAKSRADLKGKNFGPVEVDGGWGLAAQPNLAESSPSPVPGTASAAPSPVAGVSSLAAGETFTQPKGDGTRAAPAVVASAADLDTARDKVNTAPTDAQKEAGNYAKAHVKLHGLDIAIETAKGAERSGKDAGGKAWSVTMPADYGYVKRTEGKDGDQVDVYVGPNPEAKAVYVVDQYDTRTQAFDEHKAMLGFASEKEATAAYDAAFSDGKGPQRRVDVTQVTVEEFKEWVRNGDTKSPLADQRTAAPAAQGREAAAEPTAPVPEAPAAVESADAKSEGAKLRADIIDRYMARGFKAEISNKNATRLASIIQSGQYDDIVHPSNDKSRSIFTNITGVDLPKTISGTKALFTGKPFQVGKASIDWHARGKADFEAGKPSTPVGDVRLAGGPALKAWAEGWHEANVAAPVGPTPDSEQASTKKMVERVHALAEEKGVSWNDDQAFMDWSERVTGQRRLDQMSRDQLGRIVNQLSKGMSPKNPGPYGPPKTPIDQWAEELAGIYNDKGKVAANKRFSQILAKHKLGDASERAIAEKFRELIKAEPITNAFGTTSYKEPESRAPAGPRVIVNQVGKDGLTEAERKAKKPETAKEKQKLLGNNAEGNPVYEDDRGVRSYTRDGVRVTETVRMTPGGGISVPAEEQKDAEFRVAATQGAAAPDFGATNKVFTADAAEKARALLKAKLKGQVSANAPLDPEVIQAGITLAGYYIEGGARSFQAYSKAMIEDLGDVVKPYLRSWYEGVRYYPGVDSAGMTTAADIENAPQKADIAGEENEDGAGRTSTLGDDGQGALEDSPARTVSQPRNERDAGSGSPERGAADVASDRAGNEQRPGSRSGVGTGAGDVPVPARGAEPRGRGAPDVRGPSGDSLDDQEPADGGRGTLNPVARTDFTITDDLGIGEGGPVQKYNDNIAAIKLVKELAEGNRLATPAEQKTLAKYVGWGGLKSAFPDSGGKFNKGWEARGSELKRLLTEDEYLTARRTVLDAHYTSIPVVRAIHKIVARVGFSGGAVLEPSVGIGNFFGAMPLQVRSRSALTGVEFDNITGAIAKQLYQNANVLAPVGFQSAPLADGHFDVAIGNPPFGAQGVPGAKEKDIGGFSIHNYFFARTLSKLRPGGVMSMVVTHRFMDKPGGREREWIARRAKFIGAIRLPNTAFQENARTEVTTDIVILQKLPESEWGKADNTWTKVGDTPDPLGGDKIPLNQYFLDNPDMMLGRMDRSGKMRTGNEPTLAPDGRDLAEALDEAIAKLPAGIYTPSTTVRPTAEMVTAAVEAPAVTADYDIGSYFTDGGKLYRREESADGSMQAAQITADTQWSERQSLGKARHERLVGLVGIRNVVRKLLRLETSDAPEKEIKLSRKNLNAVYDKFIAKHGYLNDRGNEQLFRDDPEAPLLLALESGYDAGISDTRAKTLGVRPRKAKADKSAIFSRRVINPYKPVTKADSAKDALTISLSDRGRVDIDHMAKLTGSTPEQIARELTEDLAEPLIYRNPETNNWETRAEYLSGNVKLKAKQARAAGLVTNVAALRNVFPADLKAGDIRVRIGASWVKGDYYADFARYVLGEGSKASVVYMPSNGGFFTSFSGGSTINQTSKWGTERIPADRMLDLVINNKEIVVRDRQSDGSSVVNKEATQAALDKANEIRSEFADWLMKDPARREDLTQYYNDNFNTNVEPKFDGSHLTLPGKVPDSIIKFRRHQINAVWRGISQGKALLDHVVGAGKTFTKIAIVMERRRMGLSKKPMIVVPNHLVEQWAADFYRLYPGAKLLTMTKADFTAQNRRRMLAKIATGDWDAVITAHSSFGFMRMSPEFEIKFIEKQVDEIQSSIDAIRATEDKKDRRVADLVRSIENHKKKMEDLADKPRDNLLTFEELGVDLMSVDESHEFKNLYFSTSRRGMLGLGNPLGSKKAFDLFMKVRWLQDKQGGQGVIFATGTPVSNSLTEMYTIQRYLGLEDLERRGILSFDAWLNNFGNDYSDYELDGTGVKFKAVSRLRALTNVPEVMAMYRQYSDSVTLDQIKDAYREDNPGKEFPIPKIKGGKRQNVVVPRSDAQASYFETIVQRAQNLKPGGKDNMLAITMDARKAALDMRLVAPGMADVPGSKIHEAADNIVDLWKKWEKDRGTQLVFLDLSIPLSASKKASVEAEKYIKAVENAQTTLDGLVKSNASQESVEEAEQALTAAEEELTKKFSEDDLLAIRSARGGFSVYDDLKAKLINRGVPENEIAFIHDFDTDTKKADLFEKVNGGVIRVLLGSTSKMGAGTNVQQRAVALHHLDCPWRPSDIEQREGRVVRQGNGLYAKYGEEFQVELLAYATERTYDARMWQTQEQKLLGIEGLRNFKGDREMEEVASAAASAAEMKAVATGNPLILEDVQLSDQIRKLEASERAYRRNLYDLESTEKRYRKIIDTYPDTIESYRADGTKAAAYLADPFEGNPPAVSVNGKDYTAHLEAMEALDAEYTKQREAAGVEPGKPFGFSITINGKEFKGKTSAEDEIFATTGGRQPIRLTIGGTEFKSPGRAAKALSEESSGEIAGIPFQIFIDEDKSAFATKGDGESPREVFQSTVMVKAQAQNYTRTSQANDRNGAARNAIKQLQEIIAEMPGTGEIMQEQLDQARRELPDIAGETAKPFTKAEDLQRARARHAEVRKQLSEADKPPAAPAEPTEGEAQYSLRRPDTASNFWRWFGDSKVVTESGAPLVVYHGTVTVDEAADIEEFEAPRDEPEGKFRAYFTSSEDVARTYANDARPAGPVLSVYLSIKNPFVINARGAKWDNMAPEYDIRQARANGYDGVIIKNIRDEVSGGGERANTYIVFSPTQIKSTANTGTWDPADPRVNYSLREQPPRRHALPKKTPVISSSSTDERMKAHPEYTAAKAGDLPAAARLVDDLVSAEKLQEARATFGQDVVYVPVIASEMRGDNMIPSMLANLYAAATGARATDEIIQTSKAWHTGARPLERIITRPVFGGTVERGKRYVLVDDATVMGGTLAELANHIQEQGGQVAGLVTLVNASRSGISSAKKLHVQAIEARFGDEVRKFGIEPAALTADEAVYLLGYRDVDGLRAAVAKAKSTRSQRLRSKGFRPPEGEDEPQLRVSPDVSPRFTTSFADAATTQLREELTARLRQIDPRGRIALRLVEKIQAVIDGKASEADGQYLRGLIEIALDTKDKVFTFNHEVIHALRDMGVIRAEEWSALKKSVLANKARMADIRARYPVDRMTEDQLVEEAIADMFGDWQAGDVDPKGFERSGFQRIAEFFRAVRDWLTGKGFNTVDSVFERIASGEVGARDVESDVRDGQSPMARRRQDITLTAAFKNWFANSKVKNDDGTPFRLFHITGKDFEEFKPGGDDVRKSGRAIWLGPTPDGPAAHNVQKGWTYDYDAPGRVPGFGSMTYRDGARVLPVYAKIERPLILDGTTSEWAETVYNNEIPYLLPDETIAKLKEDGYDGIMLYGKDSSTADNLREVIVFEPTQVKSAFNTGAFDGTDPRIQYSRIDGKSEQVGVTADIKRLIDLFGPKMYSANMTEVTMKELLQNAFDGLKSAYAMGKIEPGTGKINIHVDEKSRILAMTDNGIGMSPQTVKDAFLTLAGTEKGGLSTAERSGGFGVAKMAFIFGNEGLQLETVRDGVRTTLDTTGKELLDGKAVLKTERTTDPNGTIVKVKVPATYVDDKGADAPVKFSNWKNSYEIISRPLIGDVEVRWHTSALPEKPGFWKKLFDKVNPLDQVPFAPDKEGELLPLGRFQNMKDMPLLTTGHFHWGDIEVYFGAKKSTGWPKTRVLSSGLYQFDTAVTKPGDSWTQLPYDIIMNVKPKVEADHAAYPFTKQREEWNKRIIGDIGALKTYLQKIYLSRELYQQGGGFAAVQVMPVSRDATDGGVSFEDPALERFLPKKEAPSVTIAADVTIEGSVVRADGKTIAVDGEKLAVAPDVQFASYNIDPRNLTDRVPYFYSNLNIDIFEETARRHGFDQGKLRDLMARLGTVVLDFRAELGKLEGFEKFDRKHTKAEPRLVGVALDKEYHGVNIKVPYNGFFINPLSGKEKTPRGLAAGMVHTMFHEAVHEHVSGHNESFTSAIASLYGQWSDAADLSPAALEDRIRAIIEDGGAAFAAMKEVYNDSATKNAAEPGEGQRSANTDGRAPRGADLARGSDDQGRPPAGSSARDRDAEAAGERSGAQSADLGVDRPAFSLRRGSIAQERAINKAIAPRDKRSLRERISDAFANLKEGLADEFTWAVADEFHGLRKMGKALMPKSADRELGSYVGARLARHAAGQIEAFLRWGAPVWDDEQAVLQQDNSGGLYEIVEPVYRNGMERLFDGYAYARRVRSQDLIGQDRERNLTEADVDNLLALAEDYPVLAEVFDKIQAYKKKVLDAVEGMGLINAEQRAVWEQADHVPFYRVNDDRIKGPGLKKGLGNQSAGIRRLSGQGETFVVIADDTGDVMARFETVAEANAERRKLGDGYTVEAAGEPIVGVVENIAKNITHLLDAAMKNHAAVMAIDEALELGWAEKAPMERTQALVPNTIMAKTLRNQGIEVGEGAEGIAAVMAIAPPVKPGNDVIAIRRDGVVEYYKVEDKLVFRALSGLYRSQMSIFVKPLAAIKNLLTRTVTSLPGFMARNWVRDSMSSWLISDERGINFYGEMVKSMGAVFTRADDPKVRALMSAGGDTGWYQNAPEDVVAQLRRLEQTGRVGIMRFAKPRELYRMWERVGRASELANRMVTFEAEMKLSGNTRKAAFQAADLMDFQLKGGSDLIQFLTAIVPFLNARIQGLYKLGRVATTDQQRERRMFAAKATMMIAFTLALAALNAGDDDDDGYNDLPEFVKDGSWVINNYRMFGEENAKAVGLPRFFLIPKPFELGVLFGTVPERIVQLVAGNDRGKDTWHAAWNALVNTFAFNPLGNPLSKEIVEQWANRDTFTGLPIESEALRFLPAADRYTPSTSEAAKAIGGAAGVSPLRIEHAVKGFTGTLGVYTLAAIDATARALGVAPSRPELRLDETEIIRSFVAQDPARGTKWLERFYEMRSKADALYKGTTSRLKEGNQEKARDLAKKNVKLLIVRKALDDTSDGLSEIRKAMKEVRRSVTLSPAEKRKRLDELYTQRNLLAKRATQAAEKATLK